MPGGPLQVKLPDVVPAKVPDVVPVKSPEVAQAKAPDVALPGKAPEVPPQ